MERKRQRRKRSVTVAEGGCRQMDHQKGKKKKKKLPLEDNLYFINAGKITLLLTRAIILPTLKMETSGTGGGGRRGGREGGGRGGGSDCRERKMEV